MKIWSIYYVSGGSYGLSAVAVAHTKEEALALMILCEDDNLQYCEEVGIYTGEPCAPHLLASESL